MATGGVLKPLARAMPFSRVHPPPGPYFRYRRILCEALSGWVREKTPASAREFRYPSPAPLVISQFPERIPAGGITLSPVTSAQERPRDDLSQR